MPNLSITLIFLNSPLCKSFSFWKSSEFAVLVSDSVGENSFSFYTLFKKYFLILSSLSMIISPHLFSNFLTWVAVNVVFIKIALISFSCFMKSPNSLSFPFVKNVVDDIFLHLIKLLFATDSLKLGFYHSLSDSIPWSSMTSSRTPLFT